MQPYFFPYIGYWQLMNAVDKYIVYDDVNFIKGGWINRNRILLNGEVKYFNLPMLGASPNKAINEVGVNNELHEINKKLKLIEASYKKAPYFDAVYSIIEKSFACEKKNIAEFILNSFVLVNEYLGIETELILSSTLNKDNSKRAQDKVIDICKLLEADEYYNAINGQSLYSKDEFEKNGIKLSFLCTKEIQYSQFDNAQFFENLSIIDVMMFNSKEEIQCMLNAFDII